MDTIGTGAGKCGMTFQIGSVQYETIRFYSDTAKKIPLDVTAWNFEFFIRENEGARSKLFNLTMGNGISFLTYSDTAIVIVITAAQASIEEGEYYFELRRRDLNLPVLYGPAYFNYRAS